MLRRRKHRKPEIFQNPGPDSAVIRLMNKYRSDLTKLRPIWFYLYFPSKENAFIAKSELIASGFSVEIEKSATDSTWLCLATKEMIADDKELTKLRRYFTKLTGNLNGNYDGWETQM